jgi:hypothetical protein
MSATDLDYARFLATKTDVGSGSGFDPIEIPGFLKPFQAVLTEWAIRQGRAAILADCGLGKTPMLHVWADNVIRKTGRPVLVLTPLAVSAQTVREAAKFGFKAQQSRDGDYACTTVVTNYEKLHLFKPEDFAGCVCDEAGILKNFDGKTRDAIIEFMRTIPYRLLTTATAAPNDYPELGNHSECLGQLGYQDMITRFFKQETQKDHLGWGRTKYRMRAHGEHDFWRWVCSWARACRKPSDLGFDDGEFILPKLIEREHVVSARTKRPGFLIDMPAMTLPEQKEERRRTIQERCELVAELVNHDRPALVWCHLNPEGDLLAKLIKGSVQVSGRDSDTAKETAFQKFEDGTIRVLVTKPEIAGWGLNWQHCAHQTWFPSHSFEQRYQGVARSWRFGQKNDVVIDTVASEGEAGISANYQRKAAQANLMFDRLVTLMNAELRIERTNIYQSQEELPPWLSLVN